MTFDDNAYACAGPSNGPSQPLDGRLEHHGAIHLRQHATIRTHGSNHINQPRLQAPAHCSRRVAAHASRIIDMPERTGGMCRQRRIQRNRERGTHHHECGHLVTDGLPWMIPAAGETRPSHIIDRPNPCQLQAREWPHS